MIECWISGSVFYFTCGQTVLEDIGQISEKHLSLSSIDITLSSIMHSKKSYVRMQQKGVGVGTSIVAAENDDDDKV